MMSFTWIMKRINHRTMTNVNVKQEKPVKRNLYFLHCLVINISATILYNLRITNGYVT